MPLGAGYQQVCSYLAVSANMQSSVNIDLPLRIYAGRANSIRKGASGQARLCSVIPYHSRVMGPLARSSFDIDDTMVVVSL